MATRAGIAKGTIYLYFPSKQAVFEELIRSAIVLPLPCELDCWRMRSAAPRRPTVDPPSNHHRTILGKVLRRIAYVSQQPGRQLVARDQFANG
ncbi:MAG: helix-turn-helix domain-containing protein [Pseudomonadota bacterium]